MMKRLISLVLLLSFALSFSIISFAETPSKTAEGFNASEYTDEALLEIQGEIVAELVSRRERGSKDEVPVLDEDDTSDTANDDAPDSITLDGWEFDSSYVNNEYYDIVETATFKSIAGYTVLVHKLLAKQDVYLSSTVIATAPNGDVIGKKSDDIVLTKGKSNYFSYYFESDITNATLTTQLKTKSEMMKSGERNAVEMVDYNISGDHLYITFKQVGELDYFSQFKLLYYKNDKIVDIEKDGIFSVYAENLTGIGTTDVASVWIYGKNFDRIEYIFEL